MYATWDFIKRHRRKIAVGTVVASTVCGAKWLLESRRVNQLVQQYLQGQGTSKTSVMRVDTECLNEARRHFLFDVHQQSCDKALHSLVVQLRKRIDSRFNTDELLEELRNTDPEVTMSAERKVEIWEQLKVRSVAKVLSVLTLFPLVTLVLKTQKSILCQLLYQSLPETYKEPETLYESGMQYMKSLWSDDVTTRQSKASESSAKAQTLFNESVQFLLTEGIDLLFGILAQIATDLVGPMPLSEQMSAMDVHFLLEQARARVKAIGAAGNFSEFVLPTAQLNLPISGRDGKRLQELLEHFVLVLQTQKCRKLMEDFGGQYLEAVLQQLDEALPEGKALPLAKLVPRLCNAVPHISASDYTSVFHATLTSVQLHQFTQFVSQCSAGGEGTVELASLFASSTTTTF